MPLKTIFLFLGLLLTQNVYAQNCDEDYDTIGYEHIKNLVLAHMPVPALVKADSILNLIKLKGLYGCKTSLLIEIEKAEALELLEKYEKALTLCYSVIEMAKKRNYWVIVADSYISIGRILEVIGRGIDCKRNLDKAYNIIKKYDLNGSYARFAIRYSSYHRVFDNLDSSRFYAEQGILYGEKYDITRSVIDGNLLLGILSDKNEEAIFYFSKARDLFLENNSFYGASLQSLNIAHVYISLKDHENANIHISDALKFMSDHDEISTDSFYIKYSAYNLKTSIFESNHQLDSALYYSKLSHYYHIKSTNSIDQEKINEIEILKALEDNNKEIENLQHQKKLFISAFIVGFGILILFIILLIRLYKKDKKISQQHEIIYANNIELNNSLKKQSTFLAEIHHRVKNNLQLVISLLILQGEKAKSKSSKIQLLDISNKIRSITLIHDQLYLEGEFDTINVEKYFNKLFLHFNNILNEESFSYKIKINNVFLNLDTLLPIGIICTELISNSIKYASPPNDQLFLTLDISQEQNIYLLTFSDNGMGILEQPGQDSKGGMGTLLVQSLVRQLKGELQIYNKNGATFIIKFKEKIISPV